MIALQQRAVYEGFAVLGIITFLPIVCYINKARSTFFPALGLAFAHLLPLCDMAFLPARAHQGTGSVDAFLAFAVLFLQFLVQSIILLIVHRRCKHLSGSMYVLIISFVAVSAQSYLSFFIPYSYSVFISDFLLLIQPAEWGGVSLVSYVLLIFNGALYLIIRSLLNQRYTDARKFSVYSAIIILLWNSIGYLKINSIKQQLDDATDHVKVLIVQPNTRIPAALKAIQKGQFPSLKPIKLTKSALIKHPDIELVIWPEAAIVLPPNRSYHDSTDRMINLIVDTWGVALLFNKTEYVETQHSQYPLQYNATYMYHSKTGRSSPYYKQILFPAGEKAVIPFLGRPGFGFENGTKSKIFQIKKNFAVIPSICYEVLFPKLVKEAIDLGGTFLVSQVSLRSFEGTPAMKIYQSMARFRAVEFRVPLVIASVDSRTTIISPAGEVVSLIDENIREGVLVGDIKILRTKTIYYTLLQIFGTRGLR